MLHESLLRKIPENEYIEVIKSPNRVIKILRLLLGIDCKTVYSMDSPYRPAVSQSYLSKIENCTSSSLDFSIILHFCYIFNISLQKFMYYVDETKEMTWIEAAEFISDNLSSGSKPWKKKQKRVLVNTRTLFYKTLDYFPSA